MDPWRKKAERLIAAIRRGEITMPMILTPYQAMLAAGIPCDSHESDLYVPVSEKAWQILKEYDRSFTVFVDQHDKKTMMYDIPFAFDPWWERRAERKGG